VEDPLAILGERWRKEIFSTRSANRKKAEDGVRRTYRAAGLPEPKLLLWFDGLLEAALAAEQLGSWEDLNWRLPPKALRHRQRVQRELRQRLGLRTWRQVVRAAGMDHDRIPIEEREVVFPSGANQGTHRVKFALHDPNSLPVRLAGYDPFRAQPVIESTSAQAIASELDRASRVFLEQQRELFSAYMGPGVPGHTSLDTLSPVFARHYPFGFLFQHEALIRLRREPASAPYAGLCATAHSCCAWWAFSNAAILADRPLELHLDAHGNLHHPSGPAIVYRSGLAL
jgi:hypothetical protein